MRARTGRQWCFWGARPALAFLASAALAFSIGACGGSGSGDITLRIGSRGTPEEEILGRIYAQALKGAGYEVKGDFDLETEFRDAPLQELKEGRISGYPEHVDAALSSFFSVEDEDLPSSAQKAYSMAKADFEKERLMAFPPTPYGLSRPVGVLRTTAEKRHLKTVSDLRGQAENMTLLGFTDCHFALDCLAGIERLYHIYFRSISYMYKPEELRRRYETLENGKYDALTFYSTDGRLAGPRSKFVALEDDKHAFQAGNVIFVTRPKVVEEAGPEFEATILAAQKGLTLPIMQRLDAEVELEHKSPTRVAAGYLKRVGLGA
jgi:glycine betaine/choline ABC-type transport system substrate-binding protein